MCLRFFWAGNILITLTKKSQRRSGSLFANEPHCATCNVVSVCTSTLSTILALEANLHMKIFALIIASFEEKNRRIFLCPEQYRETQIPRRYLPMLRESDQTLCKLTILLQELHQLGLIRRRCSCEVVVRGYSLPLDPLWRPLTRRLFLQLHLL